MTTDKIMPEFEPNDERDALWKPLFWLPGDNHRYLHWVARLPQNQVGHLGSCYEAKDGKVWLTSYCAPWMEDVRGQRLLAGLFVGGAHGLNILLQRQWADVRRTIEQAGEDPFSLPIVDMVVQGLWWEETRLDALAWVRDLPYEIAAHEDIVAMLGILATCNPTAASLLVERNFPQPRPWKPFYLCFTGSAEIMLTPGMWRAAAKKWVLEWGYPLHEVLASRLDTEWHAARPDEHPFILPGIETSSSLGETLKEWSLNEGLKLVEPELEKLTIDPRVGRWQEMLRRRIAAMNATENLVEWIYAEEIERESGSMIGNGDYGLVHATLRAFRNERDFEVYKHTFNNYAGEGPKDRYFVIQRRTLPPSISIG